MTFKLNVKTAEQIADEKLSSARAGARLTKRQLCLELASRNILSDEDCVAASKGEWPSAMVPFLKQIGDIDPALKRDAEIEWAGSTYIERMDTNILTFASLLDITPEVADEIFGIEV